jgi:hypothetical protein
VQVKHQDMPYEATITFPSGASQFTPKQLKVVCCMNPYIHHLAIEVIERD